MNFSKLVKIEEQQSREKAASGLKALGSFFALICGTVRAGEPAGGAGNSNYSG